MFAGKKSAQIREILISESAWEEMTCLFAPSLTLIIGREKFAEIAQGYLKAMEGHDFVSEQQLHALCTDMRNGGLDSLYLLLSDGLVMQDFIDLPPELDTTFS
ncbi:hypothetical protein [Klebsiella variicola]|uniref:hypothetical protein n=1 Tax=Klebsiella variicola TaxID=244366 RepID=UPI0013EF047C|nr:hypothetical protein [Klebsiella variicola]